MPEPVKPMATKRFSGLNALRGADDLTEVTMHADLETRHRVLLLVYRRYLAADRAWSLAPREVKAWFPSDNQPNPFTIGDPGSRIRRLYDNRDRAMLQLHAARLKLRLARRRIAERNRKTQMTRALFLTHTSH